MFSSALVILESESATKTFISAVYCILLGRASAIIRLQRLISNKGLPIY